ncbi:sulfotransferase family 2 domain-containing protein [Thalassovita sp.]|jgi:hypothetical protein|uniref:sulfotransferase family 2 domain-containing protein n=1 Tax=Thalassovita sp. TaxID=1979401 RepID=UPI003B5C4D0E
MYSSKHAFLYLHVSKTGGNSIQQVLLPFSDDEKILRGHQDGVDRFGLKGSLTPSKHASLAEYEALRPGVSRESRVIISVRDPFQRALSGYFSPHRWMHEDPSGGYTMKTPHWDETAFFEFLDAGGVQAATDWLRLEDGPYQPDHVIRFESLQDDLAHVVLALGLPEASARLPHVNKSAANAQLRAKLGADNTLRNLVLDRYREDAELFGYG